MTSSIYIPNLFSLLPVIIFSWVWASILGFILTPKFVFLFNLLHISFNLSNSSNDSTLIQNILLFIACSISSSVLPIPANTIFSGGKCLRAYLTSPPETQSAPNSLCDANILTIFSLKLDFNEKWILILSLFANLRASSIVWFNKVVL